MDAVMLVEVLDVHGHVQTKLRVSGAGATCRIGRSLACDVVVDDAYAAAEHTLLTLLPDGQVLVQDLGTRNGTRVDGHRIDPAAGRTISHGEMHIGRARVLVRTLEASLPPERLFRRDLLQGHRTGFAVTGMLVCFAFAAFLQWTYAPERLAPRVLIAELVALTGLALWVGAWTLISRLTVGAWQLRIHLSIAAFCTGLWALGVLALPAGRLCAAVELVVAGHGRSGGRYSAGSSLFQPALFHPFSPAGIIAAGLVCATYLQRRLVAGGTADRPPHGQPGGTGCAGLPLIAARGAEY